MPNEIIDNRYVLVTPVRQGMPGPVNTQHLPIGILGANVTIPTSGGVAVIILPPNYLRDGDSVIGQINGIDGTLSRSGNNYTFTRTTAGVATAVLANVHGFIPVRSNELLYTVDNIAALKARPKPPSGTQHKVMVLGYYTVNDGGGGVFLSDVADTTTADDIGLCVVANDGCRWKRLLSGSEINLRWFGAKGDSVTDDTAALQACLAAAIHPTTRDAKYNVYCPMGKYRLTAPIDINARGFRFRGDGRSQSADNNTVFRWTNSSASSLPIFRMKVAFCLFTGFTIYNVSGAPVYSGIRIYNPNTPAGYICTSVAFEDVTVTGGGPSSFTHCIEITGIQSKSPNNDNKDTNNEYHSFKRCTLYGYTESAILMERCSQAHNIIFTDCEVIGVYTTPPGKHIVKQTPEALACGYFHWRDGGGGYSSVCDFILANAASGAIVIDGWNSEGSRSLLSAASYGTYWPIIVRNCRFDSGGDETVTPGGFHGQGYLVFSNSPGPLVLEHNLFNIFNAVNNYPRIFNTNSLGELGQSIIANGNHLNVSIDYDATKKFISQTSTNVICQGNTYGNWTAGGVPGRGLIKEENRENEDSRVRNAHVINDIIMQKGGVKKLELTTRQSSMRAWEVAVFGTITAGTPDLPSKTCYTHLFEYEELPGACAYKIRGVVGVRYSGNVTANTENVCIAVARVTPRNLIANGGTGLATPYNLRVEGVMRLTHGQTGNVNAGSAVPSTTFAKSQNTFPPSSIPAAWNAAAPFCNSDIAKAELVILGTGDLSGAANGELTLNIRLSPFVTRNGGDSCACYFDLLVQSVPF